MLASSPLPADLLTEGGTGEIRDFKTSMKVERDGHAATFRGLDRSGRTIAQGRVIESAEPHDPRTGLMHLACTELKRGTTITGRVTALTVK